MYVRYAWRRSAFRVHSSSSEGALDISFCLRFLILSESEAGSTLSLSLSSTGLLVRSLTLNLVVQSNCLIGRDAEIKVGVERG